MRDTIIKTKSWWLFYYVPMVYLICFSHSIYAQSITDSNSPSHRIINGQQVGENKYPWMVGLLKRGFKQNPAAGIKCGGSLIHPKWVLTAAHCVSDSYSRSQYSIWLNHPDLTTEKGMVIDVAETFIHPFWISREYDGDIALLKLQQPVDIEPVALTGMSYDQYNYSAGTLTTVMGWGGTEVDGGSPSNKLMEVEVPIVEQSICNATMKVFGTFDEGMLCAGFYEGGKDSCYGDSGGPLIVNTGDKIEQIGLVSAGGDLCAQPNEYGTYTRIESYADWISETMCKNNRGFNESPSIETSQHQQQVTLKITESNSPTHRLYYAPYPDKQPTTYIDLQNDQSFSTVLNKGSQYYIAVRGYDGPCTSQFSTIKTISVE